MLNSELYAINPAAAIKSRRARLGNQTIEINQQPGTEAPGCINDKTLRKLVQRETASLTSLP